MLLLAPNVLSYFRGLVAATTLILSLAGPTPPDLYIMAMSHQPEFCYQHKSEGWEGCQHPRDYWKTHLTIHGLWPEYSDGSWPSTCTREPLSNQVIEELKEGLDMYWPNVKDPESDAEHDEFWRHEWSKHGTCSGLKQKEYFESALKHAMPTPEMIQHGSTVDKVALLEAYGGPDKVVAVCINGRYLSEVRSCLSVGEDGSPQVQIPCPPKALQEDNCGDTIIIPRFPTNVKEVNRNLRGASMEAVDLVTVE
jgi:ribonuclease T2